MKKNRTAKVASIMFGIGIACLLSSCDKGNELMPEIPPVAKGTDLLVGSMKEVKVVDGVLKFESKEHFKNVMEDLQKSKTTDGFDNLEGFESMPEVLKSFNKSILETMSMSHNVGEYGDLVYIQETGEYDRLVPIVRDRTFASVLNKDGMLQIGDQLLKVTKDKTFMVIGRLSKEQKQSFDNAPQSFPNVQSQDKKMELNTTPLNSKNAKAQSANYYTSNGTTYRFGAGLEGNSVWGIYWYFDAFALHEELCSVLWWDWWKNTDVEYISLNVDGILLSPYGIPYPVNGFAEGRNTCYTSWGDSGWFSPSWGWAYDLTTVNGVGKGRDGIYHIFNNK